MSFLLVAVSLSKQKQKMFVMSGKARAFGGMKHLESHRNLLWSQAIYTQSESIFTPVYQPDSNSNSWRWLHRHFFMYDCQHFYRE